MVFVIIPPLLGEVRRGLTESFLYVVGVEVGFR